MQQLATLLAANLYYRYAATIGVNSAAGSYFAVVRDAMFRVSSLCRWHADSAALFALAVLITMCPVCAKFYVRIMVL